jgi:hypothetical protein
MFLTLSTAQTFQARPGHFPVAASSFCGRLKQAQEQAKGHAKEQVKCQAESGRIKQSA